MTRSAPTAGSAVTPLNPAPVSVGGTGGMTGRTAAAAAGRPTMSDLRDRIAAVLFDRLGRDLGYADAQWDSVDQAAFLADADAVIAELQITKRFDANIALSQFRYITPWEKS